MKRAIGDNLIPRGQTFESGLAVIQRAGFEGVELWLGGQPWFNMSTSDAALRDLKRQIDNHGLAVSNVCNTLDWDQNVCARDPQVRTAAHRHIERQIEAAQIFGTDAILVVAGIVTEELPYNEVYRRTLESMQMLAPIAAKAQVRIGLENCCAEQRFLITPREFALFLDDVRHPAVGLHMDVGNIHETGFPEQWIEMHGPRITRVHLKDVHRHRGRCGSESVYTNIFLGDNNWPAIRTALDKVHYDGWIIAEMEARYGYAADQQFYDTAAAMKRFAERRFSFA
jgi:L-ribulose-5-phosphate 3-epimerase